MRGRIFGAIALLPLLMGTACLGDDRPVACHLLNAEDWWCDGDGACSPGCVCVGFFGSCERGCRSSEECPAHSFCPYRACFLGCDAAVQCTPGCRDHSECAAGTVCIEGKCVPGCRSDSECLPSEACIVSQFWGRRTAYTCMRRCQQDSDCADLSSCRKFGDAGGASFQCGPGNECVCSGKKCLESSLAGLFWCSGLATDAGAADASDVAPEGGLTDAGFQPLDASRD